jgi:hypothetical protein
MSDFASQLACYMKALCDYFGVDDPLAGRSAGRVPRRGSVAGTPFLFHGKGVRFELGDRLVDVDFCQHELEVDWWRFQQFLAPIEERSSVEGLRDSYVAALPEANALQTRIGGRVLVWKE